MKPKVYLETSVISYLASRPNRDLIVAANQQSTQEWWEKRLAKVDVYISQVVVREVSAGDADAVAKRLEVIAGFSLLEIVPEAVQLVSPHLSVVGNRDTEYTGEHGKTPLKKLAESV
ncbi:MAG: hypothetical protein WA821_12190 [Anaerolineales bacterium]